MTRTKKRSILTLLIGVVVVAAAGYLVAGNLTGRSPLAAARSLLRAAPPPGAGAGNSPGTNGGAAAPRGGSAAGPPPTPQRLQAHPVETTNAATGNLRIFVTLTGEVVAATRVSLFPEVAGKVDKINVGVGSRVDPETVLLTVDPSRPGTRYEPNPLRSPIAGTVIDILVERGQSVSTGTPAVTVATVGDLELVVRVPERYASIVTWQTAGRVSFDTGGGRSFGARVKRLPPVIDPVSRSKEVAFTIPAGVPGIEPGMFGTVELVAREVSGAVVVPFETIVQETGGNYIFVAQEGRAQKRRIEIGMLAGESVEVISGIAEGEKVVTSGQSFLEDGSPIRVVRQTAQRAAAGNSSP